MKNIRRNIVFSGLGYVLPLVASLVAIPLMLKYMGDDVYGLYIICISLIGFMNFADLGIGQAIIKFVSQYEASGETDKINAVLNMALLVYIGLGGGLAAGIWFTAESIGQMLTSEVQLLELTIVALQVAALAFLLSYVNQFFFNLYKAYHRFDIPAVLYNGGNIAGLLVSVVFAGAGLSLVAILWGYVIIQAATLLLALFLAKKVLKRQYRFSITPDLSMLSEMLRFSAYTFVSNLMGAITTRLDKFIVGALLGTQAVVYYHTAYTIVQMANGILHTLSQIAFPRFSELAALQDRTAMQHLYRTALVFTMMLSLVINLLLLVVGESFLLLWLHDSPDVAVHATVMLKIIAIYFFFQSSTIVTYWAIQGLGQAKLIAVTSVVTAVLYLAALYWMARAFGYQGVAWALFALLIFYPLLFYWIERWIGVRVWEFFVLLGIFSLLGMGAWYGLDQLNGVLGVSLWLGMLVNVSVVACCAVGGGYALARGLGLLSMNKHVKRV